MVPQQLWKFLRIFFFIIDILICFFILVDLVSAILTFLALTLTGSFNKSTEACKKIEKILGKFYFLPSFEKMHLSSIRTIPSFGIIILTGKCF